MRKVIELLAVALVVFGCKDLSPKHQQALTVYECKAKALEPYVGDFFDAADLVRDMAKGQVDMVRLLDSLGWAVEDIAKAAAEVRACEPLPPSEAPAVVRAPPPGYGRKVM